MAINFPNSPSVNDTHVVGDVTYTWDGTSWTASAAGSASLAIDDLTDVDTTTAAPSTDDSLKWNGTNWVPYTPSSGGAAWEEIHYVDADLTTEYELGTRLKFRFNGNVDDPELKNTSTSETTKYIIFGMVGSGVSDGNVTFGTVSTSWNNIGTGFSALAAGNFWTARILVDSGTRTYYELEFSYYDSSSHKGLLKIRELAIASGA